MKTSILKIFTLVAFVAFTSCGNKAKEAETKEAKEATVAEVTAVTYEVNTEASTIEWKGYKPTGSHFGTIAIQEGTLEAEDGNVESGNFTIDMNSIDVDDIPVEEEGNAKLTGHLKSADFFDVESYPTATFELTGIETVEGETMLSGNLTLKETTNNISFPVTTDVKDDTITLTSETFTIDRSKWNVKYGSKSFFDDLGDKFINDGIELKVSITADKTI
ncbi:YceI family protein [Winogradskyella vidalii]|uniref:YceI family protein n=1 Tax=Winogradskyella vidalii TaxID=2615024 RepID=UPI0015CD67C1|nr:YceI family protein [Winogradskyella vidalii]